MPRAGDRRRTKSERPPVLQNPAERGEHVRELVGAQVDQQVPGQDAGPPLFGTDEVIDRGEPELNVGVGSTGDLD